MKQLGLFVFSDPSLCLLRRLQSHFSTINSEESNESEFCSDVFLDSTLEFWSSRIGERPRNLQLLTSKQSDSPVGTVLACALRNTGLEHYQMGSTLIVESCNMCC